jgi:hypothetical protein
MARPGDRSDLPEPALALAIGLRVRSPWRTRLPTIEIVFPPNLVE